MARSSSKVDHAALERVARNSLELQRQTKEEAEKIVETAKQVFIASQRGDNEARTSETTPPKYLFSFSVRRIEKPDGTWAYEARNDDPSAVWVEFGAHAGGRTAVLRYRPLARALDIVAMED